MTASPCITDEHRSFQGRVRELASARIAPVAKELDETGAFPWETVRALADEGAAGHSRSPSWAGSASTT